MASCRPPPRQWPCTAAIVIAGSASSRRAHPLLALEEREGHAGGAHVQIEPGGEGPSGAADEHDPHRRGPRHRPDGGLEAVQQRPVHGVQLLRAVERDPGERPLDAQQHGAAAAPPVASVSITGVLPFEAGPGRGRVPGRAAVGRSPAGPAGGRQTAPTRRSCPAQYVSRRERLSTLPVAGARQGGDEVHRPGALESAQAGVAEGDRCSVVRCSRARRLAPGRQDDDGLHPLPPVRVRHADHGHVGDGGVLQQHPLHHPGVDLGARR